MDACFLYIQESLQWFLPQLHMGSSQTRDWTARQTPNHWTTREALSHSFLSSRSQLRCHQQLPSHPVQFYQSTYCYQQFSCLSYWNPSVTKACPLTYSFVYPQVPASSGHIAHIWCMNATSPWSIFCRNFRKYNDKDWRITYTFRLYGILMSEGFE